MKVPATGGEAKRPHKGAAATGRGTDFWQSKEPRLRTGRCRSQGLVRGKERAASARRCWVWTGRVQRQASLPASLLGWGPHSCSLG